jgi:nitrous oxide reductase accessory protein NosL
MRTLFVALLVAACGPVPVDPLSPPPSPTHIEDVESACSSACVNLRRVGCPEGQGAISGETCERRCAIASELRSMPLACWAKAADVVAARSCGSIRCVR